MNNDIRNRMLDIYSDLARYTHMNQIQTSDTLQQIESGIRELNRQGESLYNTDDVSFDICQEVLACTIIITKQQS